MNNELLEDLLRLLHQELFDKKYIKETFDRMIQNGGSIHRVTVMQNKNKQLSQKYL